MGWLLQIELLCSGPELLCSGDLRRSRSRDLLCSGSGLLRTQVVLRSQVLQAEVLQVALLQVELLRSGPDLLCSGPDLRRSLRSGLRSDVRCSRGFALQLVLSLHEF